jgi:hypothetical protein
MTTQRKAAIQTGGFDQEDSDLEWRRAGGGRAETVRRTPERPTRMRSKP